MLWEHRGIVAIAVIAATIIGVAAGIKLAQSEEAERDKTIRITLATAPRTDESVPLHVSADFYSNKTATSTKAKASSRPKAQKPSASSSSSSSAQAVPVAAPVSDPDGISAESYVVGDVDSGDIYLMKYPDTVLPFASMSKLITALVETNLYATSSRIVISRDAGAVAADTSGLHEGESFTARELIFPLLMTSSNRAAEAFALSAPDTDRAKFLSLMNGYSWEIGMPHAHFADASGLDSGNSGTARGFFAMAKYLYESRPDILAITRTKTMSFSTTTDHDAHMLSNIHPFANDARFLGGKTGHTAAALDTMLTILRIEGRSVAFIVLRSDDRARDTNLLIAKLAKDGMKPLANAASLE